MDPLVIIGRIGIWGCSSSVLFCTFLFPYFQGCISPFYCVLFLCNSIATLSSFTNTRLFSPCPWARRPDMVSWLLCSGPHSLYCRHLLWPWSRLRLPRGGKPLKAPVLTGHTWFLVVVGLWGSISAACASFLVSIGELTPGSWCLQSQREPFLRRMEGRGSCDPSHTPCPGHALWIQETLGPPPRGGGPHKPMSPRRQSRAPLCVCPPCCPGLFWIHTVSFVTFFYGWVISIFTFLLTPVLSQ